MATEEPMHYFLQESLVKGYLCKLLIKIHFLSPESFLIIHCAYYTSIRRHINQRNLGSSNVNSSCVNKWNV